MGHAREALAAELSGRALLDGIGDAGVACLATGAEQNEQDSKNELLP